MDTFLILKIVHGIAIFLFFLSLVGQTLILFKTKSQSKIELPYRRLFMAIQHSLFTILLITGITLLYLKNFQVQPWFYAKIILFLVMISSVIKASKQKSNTDVLWIQRRAGIVLAWVAFIAILCIVKTQPAWI